MRTLGKIGILILGLLLGLVMGFTYIGAYMDSRFLVGGRDVYASGMTAEEITAEMIANPGTSRLETFVTFFGFGGTWVEGTWPHYLSLILFTVLFVWLAHRLASVIIAKKS